MRICVTVERMMFIVPISVSVFVMIVRLLIAHFWENLLMSCYLVSHYVFLNQD